MSVLFAKESDGQQVTRRQFAALFGGAVAALGLPGCRLPLVDEGSYSIAVLGDMHYDAYPKEKFHAKAIRLWEENGWKHPARLKEFDRNAAMWQDVCSRILKSASAVRRSDTAFMLQLGDLVQGDCEDNALHVQMLSEATDMLERAFPKLPIVSVCGNHDIRQGHDNRGSASAYAKHMTTYESRQLSAFSSDGIASTTFGFRCGEDLWIVLDFNYGARDVAILRKLLVENPDVRYTFIATHGPVFPSEFWNDSHRFSRWFYLGEPEHDRLRREVRALLARRNVIVLAGHIHALEFKDWFGDEGRITEMVLNTCAGRTEGGYHPAEPDILSENPATYCSHVESELFDEYRSGLKRYFASRAVGHNVLRVSDASVLLDYYGWDAQTPTKTFVLRKS